MPYKDAKTGKKTNHVSFPGTKRGDSYCARSYGQMMMWPDAASDPDSMPRKRRKAWGCKGKKSAK